MRKLIAIIFVLCMCLISCEESNNKDVTFEAAAVSLCRMKAEADGGRFTGVFRPMVGDYFCVYMIRAPGKVEYEKVHSTMYYFEIEDYMKNPGKIKKEYKRIKNEQKNTSAKKEKLIPAKKPQVEKESGPGVGMSFSGKIGVKPFGSAPIVITPDGPSLGFGF